MATRVFLIRHGATTLSAEDRFAGSTDVLLSDEGREQAALLGQRLASEKLAAIYCSPMKRTRETAELVVRPHGLAPIVRDGLREIDHGHWEQMRRSEVERTFPAEYSAWETDPVSFAPQGGESGLAVMARALPVLREAVLAHADRTIAIVSHKATLRLAIASLLGIDARGYRDRLDLSPASLSVLDFKDAVRARLVLWNDTSHYASQPRRSQTALSKWWDAPAPGIPPPQ
jgi:probable phosphoglycerate mutase